MIACSMDVQQASDNGSLVSLGLVMKEMDIAPILAAAIWREQIGDFCFQERRVSGIPFDKSTNQGGNESPCLFNMMMVSVFRPLQEKWDNEKMGVEMRTNEGQDSGCGCRPFDLCRQLLLICTIKKKKSER